MTTAQRTGRAGPKTSEKPRLDRMAAAYEKAHREAREATARFEAAEKPTEQETWDALFLSGVMRGMEILMDAYQDCPYRKLSATLENAIRKAQGQA